MSPSPSSPALRVPTDLVRVDVAFAEELPRALDVFCPPAPPGTAARLRVAALLEGGAPFLAARDPATGGLCALGARAVVWVAVPTGASVDEELFEQRRDVRLELQDGEVFSGELLYSAPAASARVLDFLNGPTRFVPVWLGERVLFVHKRFVRRVHEIDRPRRASSIAPPPGGQEA